MKRSTCKEREKDLPLCHKTESSVIFSQTIHDYFIQEIYNSLIQIFLKLTRSPWSCREIGPFPWGTTKYSGTPI